MGFLTPDIPQAEIQPEQINQEQTEQDRRDIAIRRARRQEAMTSRAALIINPASRSGGDNGLAVRR